MDMAQQGEMRPEMGGDMKAKMQQCMALMQEMMAEMGGGEEMGDKMAVDRQNIAAEVFGKR